MNADQIAAQVARAIAQVGQPVTLTRTTLGPNNQVVPFSLENAMAQVRGYQPHELTDTIMQGDREVTMSDVEIQRRQWPGPPRTGDVIAFADGTRARVLAAARVTVGATTVKHVLQVRGS